MRRQVKKAALTAETQQWPRFSRYELVGSLIRPVKDSVLGYVDLQKIAAEDLPSNKPRAYESLAAVLSKVPSDSHGWPRRGLTEDELKATLAWCSEFGLLGLLHHKARMITLAARKREAVDYSGEEPEIYRITYQTAYVRTGRGWSPTGVLDTNLAPPGTEPDLSDDLVEGDPLALSSELDDYFQAPRAVVQELAWPSVEIASLTDLFGLHLPDVAPEHLETTHVRNPGSAEFWRGYAEPIAEFVRAFNLLSGAVRFLQGEEVEGGPALVEALLEPVRLGVRQRRGDEPAQQLLTPTLLSALAVAVTRAVADGRRARGCAACGKLFFTGKKLGLYCSKKHARAAQNRRMRAIAKKKKAKWKTKKSKMPPVEG